MRLKNVKSYANGLLAGHVSFGYGGFSDHPKLPLLTTAVTHAVDASGSTRTTQFGYGNFQNSSYSSADLSSFDMDADGTPDYYYVSNQEFTIYPVNDDGSYD